jgi:TolB protein
MSKILPAMTLLGVRQMFVAMIVCASLLLGACAGTASLAPPASPPAATASPAATTRTTASSTPVSIATQSANPTTSPAPSGEILAGQIVFYDDRSAGGHQQIYIERADGSDVRQLVVSDFDDSKPQLSRDGRTVAFTRYAPDSSNIFVVNVDGTGLREVDKASCVKPCGGDEDVAWSPEGTQLAVTRDLFDAFPLTSTSTPYNVGLWLMKADGSGAHQITLKNRVCRNVCTGGAQDNRAAWSPDGKRLVFTRDAYTSPEEFGIFTIAADGSDLHRVTPKGMNVDDAAWSPDGSLILFQSPPEANQGGEQNIYTIHPDGTGLKQLTAHLSSDPDGRQGTNHAWWSPDGSKIVLSHSPGMNGVADLFVMNRDGSDLHVIADTPLNENAPMWGPIPSP